MAFFAAMGSLFSCSMSVTVIFGGMSMTIIRTIAFRLGLMPGFLPMRRFSFPVIVSGMCVFIVSNILIGRCGCAVILLMIIAACMLVRTLCVSRCRSGCLDLVIMPRMLVDGCKSDCHNSE